MKKLVVLSGAGISAESGIPTFRDADGLWEGFDVMVVACPVVSHVPTQANGLSSSAWATMCCLLRGKINLMTALKRWSYYSTAISIRQKV